MSVCLNCMMEFKAGKNEIGKFCSHQCFCAYEHANKSVNGQGVGRINSKANWSIKNKDKVFERNFVKEDNLFENFEEKIDDALKMAWLEKFLLEEKELIKQGGKGGEGGKGGNKETEINAESGKGGENPELCLKNENTINNNSLHAKSQESSFFENNIVKQENTSTPATINNQVCSVCKFEPGVEQVAFGSVQRWVGVNCLPEVKVAQAKMIEAKKEAGL